MFVGLVRSTKLLAKSKHDTIWPTFFSASTPARRPPSRTVAPRAAPTPRQHSSRRRRPRWHAHRPGMHRAGCGGYSCGGGERGKNPRWRRRRAAPWQEAAATTGGEHGNPYFSRWTKWAEPGPLGVRPTRLCLNGPVSCRAARLDMCVGHTHDPFFWNLHKNSKSGKNVFSFLKRQIYF